VLCRSQGKPPADQPGTRGAENHRRSYPRTSAITSGPSDPSYRDFVTHRASWRWALVRFVPAEVARSSRAGFERHRPPNSSDREWGTNGILPDRRCSSNVQQSPSGGRGFARVAESPYRVETFDDFVGSDWATARERSTHSARRRSFRSFAAETLTQPVIGRPIIIGCAPGSRSHRDVSGPGTRTTRSS